CETDGSDYVGDLSRPPPIYAGEESQHAPYGLIMPGTDPVRQIEDRCAPSCRGQRLSAPEHRAGIDRQERRDRLEQRRLACPVRSDEPEHVGGSGGEARTVEYAVFAIALGQIDRLQQRYLC